MTCFLLPVCTGMTYFLLVPDRERITIYRFSVILGESAVQLGNTIRTVAMSAWLGQLLWLDRLLLTDDDF